MTVHIYTSRHTTQYTDMMSHRYIQYNDDGCINFYIIIHILHGLDLLLHIFNVDLRIQLEWLIYNFFFIYFLYVCVLCSIYVHFLCKYDQV